MAPLPTATYDPTQVIVSVGTNTIVGFVKGTFVKVSYESDFYDDDVGVDGTVARWRKADRRAMVELTLMATSPSNDVLSGIVQNDELTRTGVNPISIKDGTGRTLFNGSACWVKKKPDVEFSGEALGERVWPIRVDNATSTIGGTT